MLVELLREGSAINGASASFMMVMKKNRKLDFCVRYPSGSKKISDFY